MEKFEAADKFLKLFEEHPQDFKVSTDSGRDHNLIIIKNIYRAVEVVLDVQGGNVTASNLGNGEVIRFIRQSTIEHLHALATERLEQDKIQRQVDADNKAINILNEYYANK